MTFILQAGIHKYRQLKCYREKGLQLQIRVFPYFIQQEAILSAPFSKKNLKNIAREFLVLTQMLYLRKYILPKMCNW